MTILLAGGNNRLKNSVAGRLVEHGHQVRVLCASDKDPLRPWPAGVEPRAVLPDDMAGVETAARGCDAAVVVDPAVSRAPDEPRSGLYAPTESTIAALSRANVGRLILVHAGRREQALPFSGDSLSMEVAPVYGTSDDAISLFLIMMRSLPAVPVLNDRHVTRPLWFEDLANVLAAALSGVRADLPRTAVLTGPDAVTMGQLYERIASLIDRRPARVPVPEFLARSGAPFPAALRGFETHSAPRGPRVGPDAWGVTPTPLDDGLRRLVNELDELTPLEGTGRVEVKRFAALIEGGRYDAQELMRQFRLRFRDVMPVAVGVEAVSGEALLAEGETVTLALPGRGHVQVRVEQVASTHVVVSTLRGHALAGFVRFSTETAEDGNSGVRFEVMTCDAAANPLDWMALTIGGARLQDANWTRVVLNVAKLAGGAADRAQMDVRPLSEVEAQQADRWVRGLIRRRRTAESISS